MEMEMDRETQVEAGRAMIGAWQQCGGAIGSIAVQQRHAIGSVAVEQLIM